jgi:hypothetical protein
MASLEGWSSTIELHPQKDRKAPSGRRDLNPRPPAPKAGALTKLRYSPVASEPGPPGVAASSA